MVGFEVKEVAMKNTHHAKMTELLIGPNLRWLSASGASVESGSQTVQGTLGFHQ